MELINFGIIWFMALSFGALHALDTDHLLTLTNAIPDRSTVRARFTYCLRWAVGHGAAVTILGGTVLLFKTAIPYDVSAVAEHLVGTVLLLLGVIALYQTTQHVVLARQGHAAMQHTLLENTRPLHGWYHFQSTAIGFLHGTAGSATLLALVPITQMSTLWQGFGYLIFFSLGVLLAMLMFGGMFGVVLQAIIKRSVKSLLILRMTLAIPAIGVGLWMALPLS